MSATRWLIAAWLVALAACAAVIAQSRFTSDLSAFLPRSPSPEQRILVEQLRDGVVSRLILVAIEGAERAALAARSRQLAAALRADPSFVSVDNGEPGGISGDRELLWRHRYLLSPNISAQRFSAASLRESLEDELRLLASPAGMLVSRTVAADPSGELIALLEQLGGHSGPSMERGVWFSADANRALLVAQTRAAGSDIDAQARALAVIRAAFSRGDSPADARLLLAGPGVFSVMTRERIRGDAWRLSLAATALIAAMLLALYRSLRVLALGLVPVASGALAGVAAVSLGFGAVHGITLGFGVTLIGEGVDYAIYLFTQKPAGAAPRAAFERIWPTLRLGVLTSVCGFSAMLLSGFTGLAQLGLFSIAGLLVAAAVTRWVLPALTPSAFSVSAVAAIAPRVRALARAAPRLQLAVIAAVAVAAGFLVLQHDRVWSTDLASLSPVAPGDQLLDRELRRDLGAPDIGHLVVVHAQSDEAALQAAERVGEALRRVMREGWLAGFDSPAIHLPSRQTQLARQAALPAPEALDRSLGQAVKGMPFRPGLFAPFVKDVAAARAMPLLERKSLEGSSLALKVDSLLVRGEGGWSAMLPLRGVTRAEPIAAEIARLGEPGVAVLDLKRESDALYRSYLKEALNYSLAGAAAIVALLFASLRSGRRVFDVLAPLVAAVIATAGLLAAAGQALSIFHLVGLLLVVAVGSNYSLFFDRLPSAEDERSRTLVSLVFAAVSTVIGFGVLAFSRVPVLQALGATVGIGAILALCFSAVFSRHARAL
jgi:predicted exporter